MSMKIDLLMMFNVLYHFLLTDKISIYSGLQLYGLVLKSKQKCVWYDWHLNKHYLWIKYHNILLLDMTGYDLTDRTVTWLVVVIVVWAPNIVNNGVPSAIQSVPCHYMESIFLFFRCGGWELKSFTVKILCPKNQSRHGHIFQIYLYHDPDARNRTKKAKSSKWSY